MQIAPKLISISALVRDRDEPGMGDELLDRVSAVAARLIKFNACPEPAVTACGQCLVRRGCRVRRADAGLSGARRRLFRYTEVGLG